jgi:hypothetical protein
VAKRDAVFVQAIPAKISLASAPDLALVDSHVERRADL